MTSISVAILALLVCFAIELSQLYHESWIDNIRANRLGGLILGSGFLYSDLLSYSIGVTGAFLLEKTFILKRSKR